MRRGLSRRTLRGAALFIACGAAVSVAPPSAGADITLPPGPARGTITFDVTLAPEITLTINGGTDSTGHSTALPGTAVGFGNVTPNCIGQPTGTGRCFVISPAGSGSWDVATFSGAVTVTGSSTYNITVNVTLSGFDAAALYPSDPDSGLPLPAGNDCDWAGSCTVKTLPAGTEVGALGPTGRPAPGAPGTETWTHQIGLRVPATASGAMTADVRYTISAAL